MSIVLVGSTSGSITLQEPAVAGTTVLDLPAVSGTVLTTGSPQSGGVVQVVNATYGTLVSNSTTTYSDTGLTATITPKFASSKILVLVSQNGIAKNNDQFADLGLKLLRNSSDIIVLAQAWGYSATALAWQGDVITTCYLDSPATTSATTYKTQFRNNDGFGIVYVQYNGASSTSTITLMEIAA